MNPYTVFLTSKCELEIAETALWWAENRNADQAVAWLEGLHETLATLRENPDHLAVFREQSLYEWKYTYRRILFGLGKKPTHRAIYRIQGETVYVITVRHLSQKDIEPRDIE